MASETRNLRKRRWKSSPQKSARVGLDFGQGTPSPKKRRLLGTDLAGKPDPDSFTIGSFYGKREKMHFPHSPGRRKAVDKVLQKISDENTDSGNDSRAAKSRRKSHPGKFSAGKSQKAAFDFHSSDSTENESDGQVRGVLKPTNIHQKKSAKNLKKVPLKIDTKKTPKSRSYMKTEVKSTSRIPSKPTPVVDDSNKTPVVSGKKFFKTRSPASADRVFGAVVIKKGFEVKFVARKLNVLGKNSVCYGKSDKKKTSTPATKVVEKVKAKTVKSIDPEGVFRAAQKENLNRSSCKESEDISKCMDQNDVADVGMLNETEFTVESSTVENQTNKSNNMTNSAAVTNGHTRVVWEEKADGTYDIVSQVAEGATGSEDLFSTSSKTGRSTPVSVTTPSASGSPPSLASSDDDDVSLVSGPEEEQNPKQKLFPIFTGGRSNLSTPSSCSSRLSKLRGIKSSKMSPLLKSMKTKDKKDQMGIDAGQKRFGVTQCDLCSMVYELANPTDEMMHNKFHQSLLNALKFSGWKKERVVQNFLDTGCRIVMVTADDPKYATRKVEQINRIMGEELGFPEPTLSFRASYQAFLYVSEDKTVEGCCVCEPISQAFPVLSDAQDSQSSVNGGLSQRPWYCSDTPVPASVGVSRIWVYSQARRKGVATRLLDCVRQWSVYGTVIPKNKLAFSDPTPDGKVLATKYTGTPNFLVYKFT